jgi:hypothetical protein
MWPAILPILGNLMDKLFPDPAAAANAKLQIMQMAQTGELAQLDADTKMALGQQEINKVEAASSSLFVAGPRPFIMWVCGFAFAFKFIGGPFLVIILAAFGKTVVLPEMDFSEMSTLLFALLGLGAYRTVEKIKGAA